MIIRLHDGDLPLKEHQTNLLFSAINFFAEKLIDVARRKEIQINVFFENRSAKDVCGEVSHLIKKSFLEKQRQFNMVLSKNLKPIDMLKAIAHEMVHIKQAVTGELLFLLNKTRSAYKTYWKGSKRYNKASPPWEEEAYRVETELYISFLHHFRQITHSGKTCPHF